MTSTNFSTDHVLAVDVNSLSDVLLIGNDPSKSGDVVIGKPDSQCTVKGSFKCERRGSFASLNAGSLNAALLSAGSVNAGAIRINDNFDLPTALGTVGQSLVSNGSDVVFQTIQTASAIESPDATSRAECSNNGNLLMTIDSAPVFTASSAVTRMFCADGQAMIETSNYGAISMFTAPNFGRQVFSAGGELGTTSIISPMGNAVLTMVDDPGSSSWVSPSGIDLVPDSSHGLRICGYKMPTSPGPVNYVMTSDGTGNVVWQAPSSYMFTQTFGGTVNPLDYFAVNGLSTNMGSPMPVPTIGFRFAVPLNCTLTRVSFDANSSLPASAVELYKGDTPHETISNVVGSGSLPLTAPLSFVAGECVGIRCSNAGGDLSVATLTCVFIAT